MRQTCSFSLTFEPARFQGFHSEHLLLVSDEAAGIERDIWDVAEGQMASVHARWLAIGNPIAPNRKWIS